MRDARVSEEAQRIADALRAGGLLAGDRVGVRVSTQPPYVGHVTYTTMDMFEVALIVIMKGKDRDENRQTVAKAVSLARHPSRGGFMGGPGPDLGDDPDGDNS